jgi:hypothetical protein
MQGTMKSMNIAERVCRLPYPFYPHLGASGDSSWVSLASPLAKEARESQLREKELVNYLRNHSEVIEAWIHHSEDKRCAPSHYFRREADEHVLGFVDSNYKLSKIFSSNDAVPVCAKFILEEIGLG